MKNKTILLLGGTGAIGKYLVEVLSKENNWNIYITTRNDNNKNEKNISYIIGNARDYNFISNLLENNKYNAIVDFMNYNLDEFEKNHPILLKATNHYIFLSSSRVYSNCNLINEDTPRLLDNIDDLDFLKTNRYALRKAKEENILISSKYDNWTIVRPYITYSDRRLQLGIYEKEEWLYRLLNDKPLIVNKDVMNSYTTLTHGLDVAEDLYEILKNDNTKLKKINIVTNESIKWKEVLELYLSIIKEKTGKDPVVYYSNDLDSIEILYEGGYNTKYDRLWNRTFDNKLINKLCPNVSYKKIKDGLSECLIKFIDDWKISGNSLFGNINQDYETEMDRLCKKEK